MSQAPAPIWGHSILPAGNTALRRAIAAIGNRSGTLLEPGCGAGRFVRTLKMARPDVEAFGCDISAEAVALARSYGDGVNYTVGSLLDLPFGDNTFDIVLVMDVLEHVLDPRRGVSELSRILKPGGLLHLLVPCEGQPLTLHWAMWKLDLAADLKERHGFHVQRFTRGGTRKLLASFHFAVSDVSYSMHPLGQVKDILTYLSREAWFARARLDNFAFRQLMHALWALAYVEAGLLSRFPGFSVVQHITAVKE